VQLRIKVPPDISPGLLTWFRYNQNFRNRFGVELIGISSPNQFRLGLIRSWVGKSTHRRKSFYTFVPAVIQSKYRGLVGKHRKFSCHIGISLAQANTSIFFTFRATWRFSETALERIFLALKSLRHFGEFRSRQRLPLCEVSSMFQPTNSRTF